MKRILLKISGDALSGDKDFGIDTSFVKKVVEIIQELCNDWVQLVLVVGGGNIYRWGDLIKDGVDPSDSHNLSMLSTVFNGVVLKNFLETEGLEAHVMDPLWIKFVETYTATQARAYLDAGKIVICVSGTGNPYFTTDAWGVLRALELNCDMMIKATKVDGVYDSDPVTHPEAQFFEVLSYDEVIEKKLQILDPMSVVLARDGKLPELRVVSLLKENAILKVVRGEKEGTRIV